MGFSALAIEDRVGHESVDITYKYSHLFPSKQQEMAQKLDMERREGSKTFSLEVADMKIALYCRVDGQGFGCVLPDEADKLREFFAEHQDKPALENPSSARQHAL